MILILLTLICSTTIFCQDSLHLVGTIIGESNANRIVDVKGVGDLNADGYDDFFVTKNNDEVALYLGSPNLNLSPSLIFHYPGRDSLIGFSRGANGIGDVNGDGYPDFAITGVFGDWGGIPKGKVFVYFGGPNLDTIPEYEFFEFCAQDEFGAVVDGVGDINADGFNDFVISSTYNWSDGKGKVYLFFGGDSISPARSMTFVDTAAIGKPVDSFFGISAANIGDIDGDGFDDLAISAGYYGMSPEKVYVYRGGATIDTLPDFTMTPSSPDPSFGRFIKRAGDLDGHGGDEILFVGENTLFFYRGVDCITTLDISAFGFGGYISVETMFDLDKDGYQDFIVGNTNSYNTSNVMVGAAFVYLGGLNLDTVYRYRLEGEHKWDQYSRILTKGDVDGDGRCELIIAAPDYPDYNNPLGKIYIYAYKKLADALESSQKSLPTPDLLQNYPNPFNPVTTIRYSVPSAGNVSLRVFDILGREVADLVEGTKAAGDYSAYFDGSIFPSGVYVYRLATDHAVSQRAMVLIR